VLLVLGRIACLDINLAASRLADAGVDRRIDRLSSPISGSE